MKILLYGLNFAPEPTGIGRYSGDMAAWLAAAGHQVRVVTAPPYYPEWKIGAGFEPWQRSHACWMGTWVRRVPLWVPSRPTGVTRLLHLASFALMSLPDLIRQACWRPDVVLLVAPALACAPGAWLAARASGAKCWLHVQDFEVDAAFRMGLLKGRAMRAVLGAAERWLLKRFDRVSTISRRMTDLLARKRVPPERIVTFPNWVDVSAIVPGAPSTAYRRELGLADDAVVALYSGSLAGKQGLELLPAAAQRLRDVLPQLVFVICGDGVFKPRLEAACSGMSNVRLLPLQPAARLNELLATADIHLLPQQANAADLVMPSKLTAMMSSGRPVVATADPGTEIAQVLEHGGRVVPAGDLDAFAAALVELVQSQPLRRTLGRAARAYAEEHFARDRVLVDFEQALMRCVDAAPKAPPEPLGRPLPAPSDKPAKTT